MTLPSVGRHSRPDTIEEQPPVAALPSMAPRPAPVPGPPLWSVYSNGQAVGDFREEQLIAWAREGRVNPADLLWRPGMANPAPAYTVFPFAGYFQPGTRGVPINGVPLSDDPAMRWLLPVGRSPWAIAAGYLGLGAIVLVFAPFALIVGVIALRDIKRNDKLGRGRAIFGIVAGVLGTLTLIAVALGTR